MGVYRYIGVVGDDMDHVLYSRLAERAQRDTLERQIDELRPQKEKLGEEAYYLALEPLMLQLARLYFPEDAEPTEPVDAPIESPAPQESVDENG